LARSACGPRHHANTSSRGTSARNFVSQITLYIRATIYDSVIHPYLDGATGGVDI
jgi:hypothetical protein